MLTVNTLLVPTEGIERSPIPEIMVVIYCDYSTNRLFIINYQSKARKPILFPIDSVTYWIEDNLIATAEMELPSFYLLPDSKHTQKSIESRDKRFAAIKPVVERLEEFLVPSYGSNLVTVAAETSGFSRYQIYQWTYTFLRRGQTKNALLSDNRNKVSSNRKLSGVRLGRRPKVPNTPYKQKTKSDERNLERILKKEYLKVGGKPLTKVHQEFLKLHFSSHKSVSPNGQFHYDIKQGDNCYPDIVQFRSWTASYLKKKGVNARETRMGNSKFKKDLKGRSGDAIRPNGPGEIYQIDATVGDLQLVSQFDKLRNLLVGRPTVYSVADVFSEAIVGLHVSLAPPSWNGMRLALFNAFRPKAAFAAEFGLSIQDHDWPMSVPCLKLFGDNAELTSKLSESLIEDLGITVQFGRPYRGDDKGLVEKSFDHFNKGLISNLPGFVRKDSNSRGEKDPKHDALLTLTELYRLLILYVIHHNNFLECPSRLITSEISSDGVPHRRRDVWHWGVTNRPFSGKHIPEEHLYMDLLEKGEASVHREGVYFKQLWYVCQWTLANGHQDQKANRNRAKVFDVRFMRHSTDRIFLCTSDGLKIAYLKADSDRFKGQSFDEVEFQLNQERVKRFERRPEELSSALSLIETTEQTIKAARLEQVKLSKSQIANQSLIDNRAPDLELEKLRECERLQIYSDLHYGAAEQADIQQSIEGQSKRNSAHHDVMTGLLGGSNDNDS
ncbi:hypothetical protein [uncultured Marinobacter sp.]|uniref:hypothetical protein n=1 Tax=uncultured Marinobacter sp. TaxID=187379 RepID=UPI00263655D4|nr:hypothetical protein [uncultured Marinobacter sp.]